MNNKIHVKTGDTVVVLSGKDKGKKGQVLAVSPSEGKVIVEKVLDNVLLITAADDKFIEAV